MSRFLNALPALNGILLLNNGDVKKSARELVYDKRREKVIGFSDGLKLISLTKEFGQETDLDSDAARSIVRDANTIITRTSVDSHL